MADQNEGNGKSLDEKVELLQELNEFQKKILETLLIDPKFEAPAEAKKMGISKGYFRMNLTNMNNFLGVPEEEKDKRGWVKTEYLEAYEKAFKRDVWEEKQAKIRLESEAQIFDGPPTAKINITEDSEPLKEDVQPDKSQELIEEYKEEVISLNNKIKELSSSVKYYQSELNAHMPIGLEIFVTFAAILLGAGCIFIGAGYSSYVDQLKKLIVDDSGKPAKILYFDHFDNAITSTFVTGNPPIKVDNSYLITDNNYVSHIGNDSWVNYTVKMRIYRFGCSEKDRYSFLTIRDDGISLDKSVGWFSCISPQPLFSHYEITVNSNVITIKYDGQDMSPKIVQGTDRDRGGIFVSLDKYSAIDYILVTALP